MHLKNVLLPTDYDVAKLSAAMAELIRQAKDRPRSADMALCCGADSLDDSFTGFVDGTGRLHLLFSWNEGADTRAVRGKFDIGGH
jgi:hypothetical protein